MASPPIFELWTASLSPQNIFGFICLRSPEKILWWILIVEVLKAIQKFLTICHRGCWADGLVVIPIRSIRIIRTWTNALWEYICLALGICRFLAWITDFRLKSHYELHLLLHCTLGISNCSQLILTYLIRGLIKYKYRQLKIESVIVTHPQPASVHQQIHVLWFVLLESPFIMVERLMADCTEPIYA